MNAPTVLRILDLLASIGVQVWLDGGWGVTGTVEVLVRNGFGVEEMAHGRVVQGHAEHGRIDLHPVTFDLHRNAVQVQSADSPVVYRKGG